MRGDDNMGLLFGMGVVIGICIVVTAVCVGMTYFAISGLYLIAKPLVSKLKGEA